MNNQTPINIPGLQNNENNSFLLLGGGLLLLLLILVTVVLLFVYIKRKKEGVDKGINGITFEDGVEEVRDLAEESGYDPDILEEELENKIESLTTQQCMVDPYRNGQCSPNYTLEKGCCYPDASAAPNPLLGYLELLKSLTIGIGGNIIVSAMLTAGIKRLTGRIGMRAAITGARGAATTAKVAKATKNAAKAAKLAASAARAAVLAGKAAATAGKYAMAAAGGPVGLAIAVGMAVFDAVFMALDAVDSSGYQSETTNETLEKIKRTIDYETIKTLQQDGIEYPFLFPIAQAYPEEFQAAMDHANMQVIGVHLLEELEKNDDMLVIVADYLDASEDDANAEIPDLFLDFMSELVLTFHIDRDKFIFEKLKELLGSESYMIEFYEAMSTPDRVAVTLSEQGVKEWNDKHKETWFANNDLFKTIDPPPAGEDPIAALYTDTYYVYESGPSDNPVMVPRKLASKTAIGSFYGNLVSYCEKSRKMKSTSATINPRDLGVEFQYDTGVCQFTREYCSRYGLEFKGGDCKKRPGQGFAEMIFGEELTRGLIRAFTSPPSYAKKSKGPATKGPCPPGMRDDGINCWLDPVYRGVGKIPNVCRASEPKKIGVRCYENCPDGYEPNEAVPTLCEPKCGGDKPLKRGLICYQDCRDKGDEWFNGTLLECGACNNNWKRDGTGLGCIKKGSWKPRWPYHSPRKQASIGLPKERKHHSVKCGDDKEEYLNLCYNKCSNKGDNGVYKYKGVLDWCQPEGGAGIKKGLNDRWVCPEGSKSIAGICYTSCKPGERDDGLLCNPN